jgi:hypothetical protein
MKTRQRLFELTEAKTESLTFAERGAPTGHPFVVNACEEMDEGECAEAVFEIVESVLDILSGPSCGADRFKTSSSLTD